MWLREWTMKRAVTMGVLALLVPGAIVIETPRAAASECSCGNCGSGSACACPAPEPRLETLGGQSLFWHDPCGGSYRDNFYPGCWDNDSCPPTWFASAEALPLFRDQSGSTPFQVLAVRQVEITPPVGTTNPVDPDDIVTYRRDVVLSDSDFDTEFDPGIRAVIGRALGDWYRVEFSYFGSYEWGDVASVRYGEALSDDNNGVGNLLSPFTNFGDPGGPPGLDPLPEPPGMNPIEGFDYNEFASISFSSRLDNAEVNLRRRLCMPVQRNYRAEASCLVGLRYMKVSEEFGYYSESPIATLPLEDRSTTRVDVTTDNDLFGPQLGAMAQFLVHDRAWIDAEIKGALLFNQAATTMNTIWDEDSSEPIVGATDADEDATAFLGDISVNLNYQFAPAWTIRAGYNAYWLTGVALASENAILNTDTLISKPTALNHDGKVVYHGPSLGLVWAR
jgi:hypothetical protein